MATLVSDSAATGADAAPTKQRPRRRGRGVKLAADAVLVLIGVAFVVPMLWVPKSSSRSLKTTKSLSMCW